MFEPTRRPTTSMALGAEWPRLAMVQTLTYCVIRRSGWSTTGPGSSPTPCSAEPRISRHAGQLQPCMSIADTGAQRPGQASISFPVWDTCRIRVPDKTYLPLVAFLKEGISAR